MRLIPPPVAARWARLRALALALALVPPLAPALGCSIFATTPKGSQIEQGQALTTGTEPFDAFFQAVRAIREEAQKAGDEVAGARAGASRTLGLEASADVGEALLAVRARAAKLRDGGVLLHLELTPEPKLVSSSGKAKVEASDKLVLDALEESAKSSLAVSRRLDELAGRALGLQKQRTALETESQAAFSGADAARRDELRREIAGAERVLAEAADLGSKHAALAAKFALDLAQALETGAGSAKPAPAKPGRRGPPSGGGRPATPAPAGPTPTPTPPKPSGGDDFEP